MIIVLSNLKILWDHKVIDRYLRTSKRLFAKNNNFKVLLY